MIWLSWRQQRSELLLAAGLLLILTVIFVPAGLHLASLYDHDGLAACVGRQTDACRQASADFGGHAGILRTALGWLTLLPGLIGAALAAPLVLDLEHGSVFFGWTQGVTRLRWTVTKLAVALLSAVAAAAALTLLLTWYRRPMDAVFGRMDTSVFDVEGIVPVAYVLFALGLALAVGVVWRRTAPTVVLALLGYVGARLFTDNWLRQHLVTPLAATWGPRSFGPRGLNGAWILSSGPSDRAGHPFTGGFEVIRSCGRGLGGVKMVDQACLARHGAGFSHAVFIPADRFWLLQGLEAALFGGVALVLVAFAVWWLLVRTE
jgi:hypothetical protein